MYPFFTNNIFQEKKIFFFTISILFYNLVSFFFSFLALFALQNQKCKRSWKIFRRWRVLV